MVEDKHPKDTQNERSRTLEDPGRSAGRCAQNVIERTEGAAVSGPSPRRAESRHGRDGDGRSRPVHRRTDGLSSSGKLEQDPRGHETPAGLSSASQKGYADPCGTRVGHSSMRPRAGVGFIAGDGPHTVSQPCGRDVVGEARPSQRGNRPESARESVRSGAKPEPSESKECGLRRVRAGEAGNGPRLPFLRLRVFGRPGLRSYVMRLRNGGLLFGGPFKSSKEAMSVAFELARLVEGGAAC